MGQGQSARVRVAAPPAEARRLCGRLSRGGVPAALDDGEARAELLIVVSPKDLAPYRGRAGYLLVVGAPGARYFAAGADEVVVPGEDRRTDKRRSANSTLPY